MSTGRRIARELRLAIEKGQLIKYNGTRNKLK
jgi:5-formaminoimidazole-4-carboxamide-1-beta-D-ribofuranosyl 5'-monophosphate synthetase